MNYIKYMPFQSIRIASRNKRELSAAREYGFETYFFSNDQNPDLAAWGVKDKPIWDGTIPLHSGIPKPIRVLKVIGNQIAVCHRTLELPGGAWSCHDLSALHLAYWLTRLRKERPLLIYDSHEFEMGRNAKRSVFKSFLIKRQERYLMNRCAFSIMVNDSIADEVQRIHKLKERPIVVRSTPDCWEIDESVCQQKKQELLAGFIGGGYKPS